MTPLGGAPFLDMLVLIRLGVFVWEFGAARFDGPTLLEYLAWLGQPFAAGNPVLRYSEFRRRVALEGGPAVAKVVGRRGSVVRPDRCRHVARTRPGRVAGEVGDHVRGRSLVILPRLGRLSRVGTPLRGARRTRCPRQLDLSVCERQSIDLLEVPEHHIGERSLRHGFLQPLRPPWANLYLDTVLVFALVEA